MVLWLSPDPLVLASQSAVRLNILSAAGIPVEVIPARLDERAVEQASEASAPDDVAAVLALAKARAVGLGAPGRLVIGADQTLALGERRFSKPADLASARRQLLDLRDRVHVLHSAVAIVCNDETRFTYLATTRLILRDFSEAFLDAYLEAAGEGVTTSVGAYQIEKLGLQLFERIEGDHFAILGLPLLPVLDYLRRDGYLLT